MEPQPLGRRHPSGAGRPRPALHRQRSSRSVPGGGHTEPDQRRRRRAQERPMKVAMVIPPYRYGADPSQWITVPPQGYGGIQWVVATLMDGLLEAGCEILLLGAPGSPVQDGVTVSDAVETADIHAAIEAFGPDIVHDHSNTAALPADNPRPTVSTHHLNGVPERQINGIYLSRAQRTAAGSVSAPVIRPPVNPA